MPAVAPPPERAASLAGRADAWSRADGWTSSSGGGGGGAAAGSGERATAETIRVGDVLMDGNVMYYNVM